MKMKTLLLGVLVLMLLAPVGLHAQATTNSTTLSAAATIDDTVVTVASASTLAVGQILYADQEAMRIKAISGTNITVLRGQDSTRPAAHYSGVTVYSGISSNIGPFTNTAPKAGSCTAGSGVFGYHPLIHVPTGDLYKCINSAVVLDRGPNQNLKTVSITAWTAAIAAVDHTFFIADRPYEVVSISAVFSTIEDSDADVQITKDTSTDAPGAGTNLLVTPFDLQLTANTVQTGTLSATLSALRLAAGDRLAYDSEDALDTVVGLVFTVVLKPL